MAVPQMTFNAAGNVLASQSLGASPATVSAAIDLSTKVEGQIQVSTTFGTVAATSGLQIDIYDGNQASGTTYSTIPLATYLIPSTTSTAKALGFKLPPGKYNIKLSNLDGTNGLTLTFITSATIDSFS